MAQKCKKKFINFHGKNQKITKLNFRFSKIEKMAKNVKKIINFDQKKIKKLRNKISAFRKSKT